LSLTSGVVTYHHFNPLHTDTLFRFSKGKYQLELVAKLFNKKQLISLWSIELDIPSGAFDNNIARETAVFFNWSDEKSEYIGSVEKRSGFMHAISDIHS